MTYPIEYAEYPIINNGGKMENEEKDLLGELELNKFVDNKSFNETLDFNQQFIENGSEEFKQEVEHQDFLQNHWGKK